MAEPNTLYRVMILYMLDQVEHPLSTTQIMDFILEKEYTNYFTVQETINDLISSEFIATKSTHNNTLCHLTEEGKKTLRFFEEKVSPEIREDIDTYFREHELQLRQETSIYADYYKSAGSGWDVRCSIKDRKDTVLDVTLHVQSKEQAQAVCANWSAESADVYSALMDRLMK